MIGLAGPEVGEARERVRAAIHSSSFEFPRRRVVINLAPASIRKTGAGLDLAMALAVLVAAEDADTSVSSELAVAWGELGLDGIVKPAGSVTRAVYAAWQAKAKVLLLSKEDQTQALAVKESLQKSGLLEGNPPILLGVSTLSEAWALIQSETLIADEQTSPPTHCAPEHIPTGLMPLALPLQRLILIVCAGNHHFLILGPRGAGKSHAFEWLVALQAPLSEETRIRQAILRELTLESGSAIDDNQPWGPPVRRIGAQARAAALLGSIQGTAIRPGEFSMAHGGLLLADEFPEWSRDSREALREPLESGRVRLTRVRRSVELPARFVFAANGNLCPCGGWPPDLPNPVSTANHHFIRCVCSVAARDLYRRRLSGPILDRMDVVGVYHRPTLEPSMEPSLDKKLKNLRLLVQKTRDFSISTWGVLPGEMPSHRVEELIVARPHWSSAIEAQKPASLRSRHKILRVALTLAALEENPNPGINHFAEANSYRPERVGLC